MSAFDLSIDDTLNSVTVAGYINGTCKMQDIFKKSDRFSEDIEEQPGHEGEGIND